MFFFIFLLCCQIMKMLKTVVSTDVCVLLDDYVYDYV
jgi:hypothetical protein